MDLSNLKVIILSAGLGTRLRPLTEDTPKVMLPIDGKPLLEHHIHYYKKFGLKDIFINLHYLPNKIRDYFGRGEEFGVNIKYSYEENLLGTAGALAGFEEYLGPQNSNAPFFLHYGDVISEVNLRNMFNYHQKKEASSTIAVHQTDHPHDSDIVVLDEENKVTNLYHKPGTNKYGNMGNAALYLLEPVVYDYLSGEAKTDFIKELFPKMLQDGQKIYGYSTNEYLKDMGTKDRYIDVKRRYEGDNFQNPLQS